MANLEEIARAALDGEGLRLRSLVQDWLRSKPRMAEIACPATREIEVLVTAAALAELMADRTGQPAPSWTQAVTGLPEPRFLVRSAATMKRLRKMCEEESPNPLKRRNLFAPADYLRFA